MGSHSWFYLRHVITSFIKIQRNIFGKGKLHLNFYLERTGFKMSCFFPKSFFFWLIEEVNCFEFNARVLCIYLQEFGGPFLPLSPLITRVPTGSPISMLFLNKCNVSFNINMYVNGKGEGTYYLSLCVYLLLFSIN